MMLTEIRKAVDKLPTFPRAVQHLQRALAGADVSPQVIDDAIRSDPALTINLLKLANSAWIGARREVLSVRQALVVLGLARVRDMAVTVGLAGALPKSLSGYGTNVEGLFRHSVAVGILCEQLARTVGLPKDDGTFVAGLLHDVGKLVLGTYLDRHAQELAAKLEQGNLAFIDVERQALGTDHAEIAYEVGRHWQLPEIILSAARWHHTPSLDPDIAAHPLTDIVHVADVLAHMMGFGADLGGLHRVLDTGASERLGLKRAMLETSISESFDAVNQTLSAMQLNWSSSA
jgi:putative nucleotidyltransferase with HDIG domain